MISDTIKSVAVIALLGGSGAAVYGLSGSKSDTPTTMALKKDGGMVDGGHTIPVHATPTEAQIVPSSVRSAHGRHVRVVGVQVAADATVVDSTIGKTVEVDALPPTALCNVVFEAKDKSQTMAVAPDLAKKPKPQKPPVVIVPDVTELQGKYVASQPMKIGTGIWLTILQGDACRVVGDVKGYLGSTMQEFLALPVATQAKFLKVAGKCQITTPDKKTVTADCVVPVGDSKAVAGAKPFFPSRWAGRTDLDF